MQTVVNSTSQIAQAITKISLGISQGEGQEISLYIDGQFIKVADFVVEGYKSSHCELLGYQDESDAHDAAVELQEILGIDLDQLAIA